MVKSVAVFLAGLVLAVTGFSTGVMAQEYVGGTLSEDAVFSPALNPYIVIEPLIVPEGITLTIEPGTHLYFMIGTSLKALGGTILARGEAEQPVLFDGQTDKKWDGINFSTSKTQLDENGMYVSGSILDYVFVNQTTTALSLADSALLYADHMRITNGDYGIYLQSGSTLHIHNSTVDQCSYGIYIRNSGSNVVESCMISNCDMGIFFPSNNISRYNRILNNNLSYNTNIALFMSIGQSTMQNNLIQGNTVAYNNIGLHIGNGGTNDKGYNTISSNNVRYNDIGIKLSQDADTLRANRVELNTTGVLLTRATNNYLNYNSIQHNQDWALTLTDGSNNNIISTNSICSNTSGIKITQKDFKYSVQNSFIYNYISGNENEAFLFEAGPQLPLNFNTITSPHVENSFVNHFESDIQAQENWWGTTDTAVIDSMIYDYYDSESFGEVFYKPVLGMPDPGSPISPPRMVVKRLIGNHVIVTWHSNPETDLQGYKIYYGDEGESGFNGWFDTGLDTTFVFDTLGFTDPVAVTAYDSGADGIADQPEGHESDFTYAIAGPYAGNDSLVCQNLDFSTTSATALDPENLHWTSSGDGIFQDPGQLHTAYIPGAADIASGHVFLTLSQTVSQLILTDEMELQIYGTPFLYAGNDTMINQHDAFSTLNASAVNYTSLNWVSGGDGVFSNPADLHTQYQPGAADIAAGNVQLILNLESECGSLSDSVLLVIIPTFSINGRVHHGNNVVSDGVVVAIKSGLSGSKAVATQNTLADGTFGFSNLSAGNYYIYALSDPLLNQNWVPAYYAENCFWESAYLMPLDADVYDVDINLVPVQPALPAGTGSISGYFSYVGKTDDTDSIYSKPWFTSGYFQAGSGLGYAAANHVVLLMNSGLNRIYGWTLTASDGSFHFNQLPFGSYKLRGEKAGYTNSLSPLINLAPANNNIQGIQLTVNQKKIEVHLPDNQIGNDKNWFYPNPASDKLWLNPGLVEADAVADIAFYAINGQEVLNIPDSAVSADSEIDVSPLKPGLYVVRIVLQNGATCVSRLNVVR